MRRGADARRKGVIQCGVAIAWVGAQERSGMRRSPARAGMRSPAGPRAVPGALHLRVRSIWMPAKDPEPSPLCAQIASVAQPFVVTGITFSPVWEGKAGDGCQGANPLLERFGTQWPLLPLLCSSELIPGPSQPPSPHLLRSPQPVWPWMVSPTSPPLGPRLTLSP